MPGKISWTQELDGLQPWGRKELGTTERPTLTYFLRYKDSGTTEGLTLTYLGTMKLLYNLDHSLNCHNQCGNTSAIYSMETFCSKDCSSVMLTGNITCNTKYCFGWKKLVRPKNWSAS